MEKEYNFFMKTELSGYIGEWIAIHNQKIISHNRSVKKVFSEAKKKYPNARPMITKVPDKDTMIF